MSSSPTGRPDRRGERSPAELARLRQAAYRLLAGLFLYPEGPALARLAGVARALADELPGQLGWRPVAEALESLTPGRVQRLQADYVRLFWLGGTGEAALEETAHAGAESGRLAVELEAAYARAGLRTVPGAIEPPDHLSTELEFLSTLCAAEVGAWQRGAEAEARRLLVQQLGFLARHPARWLPGLSQRLRRDGVPALYRHGAAAAVALLAWDQALLRSRLDGASHLVQLDT